MTSINTDTVITSTPSRKSPDTNELLLDFNTLSPITINHHESINLQEEIFELKKTVCHLMNLINNKPIVTDKGTQVTTCDASTQTDDFQIMVTTKPETNSIGTQIHPDLKDSAMQTTPPEQAIANFPKTDQALISEELKKVNGVDKLFTPHDDISKNFTLVIPSKLNIGPIHAKKLAESQKKMLEQALIIPSNGTVPIEIFAKPKPSLKRQRKRRFERPPQLETEIYQPRGDKQYLTPIHKNLPL
ncbi:unnamed protein product [Mytilus edulis]|uniref:Uncharacterized protein n=1 Tax=Mytilus edulis TaxID=6550 RepID=A0A8S3PU16_MYTED|nr:unnamed protein product [Mytilus edulis]